MRACCAPTSSHYQTRSGMINRKCVAGALAALMMLAGAPAHAIHADEMETLVQLYNNTGGSAFWSHISTGWDGTANGEPCNWKKGDKSLVVCHDDGRVDVLNFGSIGMTGTLPDLSRLKRLENAKFDSNKLTGSIPKLPASLQYFFAGNNFLTGTVPHLPDGLLGFYVGGNLLQGTPPEPKNLVEASLCPNRFARKTSAQDRAKEWDARLWGVWSNECTPSSRHAVASIAAVPGGRLTCTPGTVSYGAESRCSATPDAGYVFEHVLEISPGDKALAKNCLSGRCTLLVKGEVTVKGVFKAGYSVTGAASVGGAMYCPSDLVQPGGGATCVAAPAEGYSFVGATLDRPGTATMYCVDGLECQLSGVLADVMVIGTFAPHE